MASPSRAKLIKTQLLVLIATILIFTLAAIGVYTMDIVSSTRATAWPTSEGTVTYSGASRGCSNSASFWPKVRYQYSVAGQPYIGERLVFGNIGCGAKDDAESIVQKFPVHSNVIVHFNPQDPGDSVLPVGRVLDETWLGIYTLAGIFAALSLFGVFIVRKY